MATTSLTLDAAPGSGFLPSMEDTPVDLGPVCTYCQGATGLVNGAVIYPHRPDLAPKLFWRCVPCAAWVGCHNGTSRALGKPANAETRNARHILHDKLLDPLWQNAIVSEGYQPESPKAEKIIRNAARGRVYAYLGYKLGLTIDETHAGEFDLDTCRRAWLALKGVSYATIRAWAHAQAPARERTPQPPRDPALGPSGRSPCPCGSGKKYKRCHGAKSPGASLPEAVASETGASDEAVPENVAAEPVSLNEAEEGGER